MLRYIIGISFITLVIIIVRALSDGKILKRHQYAIWLIIPVCMILLPFLNISIQVNKDRVTEYPERRVVNTEYDAPKIEIPVAQVVTEKDESEGYSDELSIDQERITKDQTSTKENIVQAGRKNNGDINWGSLLKYFSFSVSAIMIIALIIYNTGFIVYCKHNSRYIGKDPSSGLNIHGIDLKGTPFLLLNRIYVDSNTEELNKYTICHEACHHKHKDYIWIWLRYLVLSLNWYNPIIWAAFILSGRDCELACDEEVLRIYGTESATDYAKTLYGMMQQRIKVSFSFAMSTGMNDGYKTMKKRITSIKHPAKKSYKALSLCLAVVLIFSSCTFIKPENGKKISKDSPWYNAEVIAFKPELNPNQIIEDLNSYLAGADDKYIAVCTHGFYRAASPNVPTPMIRLITLIDRETKQIIRTIDLFDVVEKHDSPEEAVYDNGKLIVYCTAWDPDTNEYSKINHEIDVETGKILSTNNYFVYNDGCSLRRYHVGEYTLEFERPNMRMQDSSAYFLARVFSPDGSTNEVDLKYPGGGIYDVSIVFTLDQNTVLIPAETERSYKYFKLDLPTCKLTEVDSNDYSWIDLNQLKTVYNGPDDNDYFTTAQGISKIDMKNKKFEEVMNYSSSNINMNYTSYLTIADYSEDKILLCGRYRSSNMFNSIFISDFVIVELTKADKNPHAGKTILELYIPEGEMNEVIADAIIKYNDTSKKNYIQVTERYNTKDIMQSYGSFIGSDELEAAYMNANSQLSYELAMDLMNGEGPDILMNTSGLGQLNNDNYLIDLSPYLTDLDSDKYFTNIIGKAKTDGKLYQLPVSFTIEGIQTDPKYAGKSGVGFTTEEYLSFVHETLNGKDIIESGQSLYMTKLFNGMSDTFIKNGKVDLTGSEFEVLAQYVKNNIPDNGKSWIYEDNQASMDAYDNDPGRNKTAYYCNCPGITGYLVKRGRMHDATAILGIPSADGRGPMFGAGISVAVSANATNKDACIEFVKILLSDDVQSSLALSDRFVLNRIELRKVCDEAIEYYNTPQAAESVFDYSIGTNVKLNFEFTTSDIDNLENIILSCSKMDAPDSSIDIILTEEMPAYFLGQKDLHSVIKIAQDRAQKVLDERG